MFDFGNANDGQRQAISTTEGPVLITAGPGTGKTYTLVQRAIYLIEERGVKPEDIFIATFTEKAAKELITRITNELASRNITVNVNEMYVGTFHSLCLRIIKEHLEYTRLKKNYRLLDTFDQQYLVFRNIYKFRMLSGIENVMPKGGAWKWAQAICEFSNNLTEEVVDIDAMLGDHDMEISVIAKVVNTYQAMLDEENLIDFSAIQTECYRLLTENKDILEDLRNSIKYIMVDEYQDTNYIQEQIIFLLGRLLLNIDIKEEGVNMPTTIEVNKQSVEALLGSGKSKPFVVPEYQRPYAWTDEQVETLFEDLWDFTATSGGTERESSYFLGSVVSYENEDGEQEIIDGQQRITSLFLLLRAIYTKLVAMPASERTAEANNFIGKIEPTIWRTNKLTGMVDFKNILLTSRVVNNEGNEILRSILETGKADEDAKDNYSKNYRHFQELFDKHSTENPLMVYQFIYALLNQAILLPITADTQDTALTIFSTLNDRGLPLSDADIFKAKIYNQLAPDDKKAFIDRWKDLDEQSTDANESIQQLFYYNMFYYRALDKDTKTTTPGVRKYYATNKFERLYKPELLDTLFVILNLWKVVNKGEELEDEAWSKNTKIRQTLDILTSYPNEYWKYPVVIYYVCYRNEENFETRFARFLNKLLMELMTKYLMIPTINAVKPDILKLNSAIVASDIPTFEFKTADMTQLEPYIQNPNRNAVRMLLKTLAYEHQDDLLPAKWEIEHIFPQKWQTNYFPDEPDATIKEKIEHIGNKLPFEKKLNIVAGNGYFGKKKKEYTASKIVITKAMGTSDVMDWNLESITKRDIRVSDEVVKIMNRWNNEYLNIPISEGKMGEPSEEELAQIEKFKKNGWI